MRLQARRERRAYALVDKAISAEDRAQELRMADLKNSIELSGWFSLRVAAIELPLLQRLPGNPACQFEPDGAPSRMRKYSPPKRVIFFGEDSLFT
jgi:hypothetical protein